MNSSFPLLTHACVCILVACISHPLRAQPIIDMSEFQTHSDVIIECVAAEPQVMDPVAMAFDEHQRIWVAENRGYPQSPEGVKAGTIALLEDRNGDGFYEQRTTFARHLHYPNGILPWEDGVIVTDAPDLLFMKDTDGDGVCDIRQVLLTGFDTSRSTQLRVNDPTLGPDGWIYLAGGLSGGKVKAPWQSDEHTVDMRRHDLRFHPYDWTLKPTTGKSQFGLDFDRFGNRFICMNRIQIQQVMTKDTTWGANPHFHFNKTVENLPEDRLDDLLKGYNAGARIYPLTQHLTTADSHAGTFTAACAVTVFESNGLPERYFGHAFSCDPTGNLIHFDQLIPNGPTYVARREHSQTEFVASSDPWFRPVFLSTGPDGALYICDMRRKTIEHPDYLPQEVRKRTDFESGKEMGRIYRVRASGIQSKSTTQNSPSTQTDTHQAWAAMLGHTNEWIRLMATQKLLQHRQANHPAFEKALKKSLPDIPLNGRTTAYRLLMASNALSPEERIRAIKSEPSPVVAALIQLSTKASFASSDYERAVIEAASEADPRLQFAIALALQHSKDPGKVAVLAGLLAQNKPSGWIQAAAIHASYGDEFRLLKRLFEEHPQSQLTRTIATIETLARLNALTAHRPDDFIHLISGNEQQLMHPLPCAALLLGMHASGKLPDPNPKLPWLGWAPSKPTNTWSSMRQALEDYPMENLNQEEASVLHRIRTLTGMDDWVWKLHQAVDLHDHQLLDLVLEEINSNQGPEILKAVLDPTIWNRLPHQARNRFIQSACSNPSHADPILQAIEDNIIPTGMLNTQIRNPWKRILTEDQQQRLDDLLGQQASPDAAASYERFQAAAKMAGNPKIGKVLFTTICSSCHRLDQTGYALGPDLYGIRNQAKESILLHIVDPNLEITSGFEGVEWTSEQEEITIGLLTFDNGEQLMLKLPNGLERTFQRNEGGNLRNLPFSFMPEGMIDALSVQQVADLLAYLRGE